MNQNQQPVRDLPTRIKEYWQPTIDAWRRFQKDHPSLARAARIVIGIVAIATLPLTIAFGLIAILLVIAAIVIFGIIQRKALYNPPHKKP